MSHPDGIAAAALFLASNESSYVTGSELYVDSTPQPDLIPARSRPDGHPVRPTTSHMNPAPATVNSNVAREGCELCASGRMSEVAK